MQQLQQVLGRFHTPQPTINAIIEGLDGWRVGRDTVFNSRTTAGKAGVEQSVAGWRHMFEGRPHKIWKEIQTRHYATAGIRYSSPRWVTALITKMLEIAWDLWEHRNSILHDNEEGFVAQEAKAQILDLWQNPRIQYITSIRHLVKGSVEEIQGKSLDQQQQWILRVEEALKKDRRQADSTQYRQERQYLEQFKQ
jgi:hypothetical protein